MGLGLSMYADDFDFYPGCIKIPQFTNIWQVRILPYVGGNRAVFWCPVTEANCKWDTNVNTTFGGTPMNVDWIIAGGTGTRFSYGYNDWGLVNPAVISFGLGGDINPPARLELRPAMVTKPSDMIAIADTVADRNFDGSIDPRNPREAPSGRHNGYTVVIFADGHVESPKRSDVIDPNNQFWRARWNCDNEPKPTITWNPANYPN